MRTKDASTITRVKVYVTGGQGRVFFVVEGFRIEEDCFVGLRFDLGVTSSEVDDMSEIILVILGSAVSSGVSAEFDVIAVSPVVGSAGLVCDKVGADVGVGSSRGLITVVISVSPDIVVVVL